MIKLLMYTPSVALLVAMMATIVGYVSLRKNNVARGKMCALVTLIALIIMVAVQVIAYEMIFSNVRF